MGGERRFRADRGDGGAARAHRSGKDRRADGTKPRCYRRCVCYRGRGTGLARCAQRRVCGYSLSAHGRVANFVARPRVTREHAAMRDSIYVNAPADCWSRSALDSRRGPVFRVAARHARRAGRARRHGRGLWRLRRLLHLVAISSRCGAHETAALDRIGARQSAARCPGARNGTCHGIRRPGSLPRCSPNGGCSIYPHRPETCRTYDCRVFTAAGMNAGRRKVRDQ